TNLWSDSGTGQAAQHSPVRACMGNLLIYSERPQDEAHILEVVTEISPAHPSRIILMLAEGDPGRPIEVGVSAQCWIGGSEKICCEHIRVRAPAARVHELPGVVVPLLVSDVPVHLWWRDSFLSRLDVFERFSDDVDHLIFEGLHWTRLPEAVPEVASLIRRLKGRVSVTNFNWARLMPWQQRIAQFFDRALYGPELEFVRRVRIGFRATPEQLEGRHFQCLLLAGWLAGQLGWELKEARRGSGASGDDFLFESAKAGQIEVQVRQEPENDIPTKGVQFVELHFEGAEGPSALTLQRDAKRELMVVRFKRSGACELPQKIRHHSASEGTLLLRAMSQAQSGAVFDRAFGHAVDMLRRTA
ncbi:MAG: glucose-6-phosphate dehydrogenase assembly protein OpcA, partial [Verrucomicrobiae bacterium]|nr:glucose-6-phosphate dehydrogenase assembly protein OpcA [Verrucomicrobiae bacterium]